MSNCAPRAKQVDFISCALIVRARGTKHRVEAGTGGLGGRRLGEDAKRPKEVAHAHCAGLACAARVYVCVYVNACVCACVCVSVCVVSSRTTAGFDGSPLLKRGKQRRASLLHIVPQAGLERDLLHT